jgi:hypothetical protein
MKKLTVLLAALAACSNGKQPAADDLAVEYHWREGSMPPPHHYEYDISIAPDGKGRIAFRPDYGDKPEWVEEFAVAKADRDRLRGILNDAGVFTRAWEELKDPPVGGAYSWLVATSGGKTAKLPSHPADPGRLPEVYDAIRGLVPKATWDSLRAKRDQYARDREK